MDFDINIMLFDNWNAGMIEYWNDGILE